MRALIPSSDNIRTLSASIAICRLPPGPFDRDAIVENSDDIVTTILAGPADAWIKWDDRPPTTEDGHIVGRDKLGYLHLATNLVGSKDGGWAIEWMPVPF